MYNQMSLHERKKKSYRHFNEKIFIIEINIYRAFKRNIFKELKTVGMIKTMI